MKNMSIRACIALSRSLSICLVLYKYVASLYIYTSLSIIFIYVHIYIYDRTYGVHFTFTAIRLMHSGRCHTNLRDPWICFVFGNGIC